MKISKRLLVWLVVVSILLIDQAIKVSVKMNMPLGDEVYVADWFRIHFIENNGMAWGMELGSKLFLSIFRIVAVVFGIYYIHGQLKRGTAGYGYLTVLAMILAGAAGNIFDSLFYGVVFSESTPYSIAHITEFGQGYAQPLMGKVVDMFYFPIIDTSWPDWVPFCGGDHFIFFSPVFNFADACISVGAFLLIIFFRKELGANSDGEQSTSEAS